MYYLAGRHAISFMLCNHVNAELYKKIIADWSHDRHNEDAHLDELYENLEPAQLHASHTVLTASLIDFGLTMSGLQAFIDKFDDKTDAELSEFEKNLIDEDFDCLDRVENLSDDEFDYLEKYWADKNK